MNAFAMLAKRTDESTQTARSVKQIINSFLIVFKNYALYPENHAICKTSLEKAKPPLYLFFQNNFHFRIDVQKNALIFDSQIVYEGGETEENLAFIFFRDGIEWLEFQKGLTENEIDRFFKVLYRYRILGEEPEGDLVTSLWAEDFSHIRYGVKEVFWNADNLIDLGELRSSDTSRPAARETSKSYMPLSESVMQLAKSCRLTPEDHEMLKKMIEEDDAMDRTREVPDILGIILLYMEDLKDFEEILDYLKEEFFDTLRLGELEFTLELLKNLHSTRQKLKNLKPWTVPLFQQFFSDLCSESALSVLQHVWVMIGPEDAEKGKRVYDILTLLPSKTILALMPMMSESHPLHIQSLIMDIITRLARRNSEPLKQLLTNPDETIVIRSLKILAALNQTGDSSMFLQMVQHNSKNVRKQALTHLLACEGDFLDVCCSLLDDDSDAVRWLALKHLGQTRNSHAEQLLTAYLENQNAREENRSHILACYRALGQCSADECLPFLEKSLFPQSLTQKFSFSSTARQEGALLALSALNSDKAAQILLKAARSLVPSVRIAYKKALPRGK
ncbi:MAG: HEAT repeat domain-containing protein [Desulfobacterales bacterium]|nr:HEAT repeat domain-containing protein [Desulfobacterales bacterium]